MEEKILQKLEEFGGEFRGIREQFKGIRGELKDIRIMDSQN